MTVIVDTTPAVAGRCLRAGAQTVNLRSLSMNGWNAGDIGGAVVALGSVTLTLAFSRAQEPHKVS